MHFCKSCKVCLEVWCGVPNVVHQGLLSACSNGESRLRFFLYEKIWKTYVSIRESARINKLFLRHFPSSVWIGFENNQRAMFKEKWNAVFDDFLRRHAAQCWSTRTRVCKKKQGALRSSLWSAWAGVAFKDYDRNSTFWIGISPIDLTKTLPHLFYSQQDPEK